MAKRKWEVKESKIAGEGTFASEDMKKGDRVGLAFSKEKETGVPDEDYVRTKLGVKTNHSGNPNMEIVREGKEYYFVANKSIKTGTELTVDYKKFDFEGEREFAYEEKKKPIYSRWK